MERMPSPREEPVKIVSINRKHVVKYRHLVFISDPLSLNSSFQIHLPGSDASIVFADSLLRAGIFYGYDGQPETTTDDINNLYIRLYTNIDNNPNTSIKEMLKRAR